jgi:AAA+ superfamily predicted ATPase
VVSSTWVRLPSNLRRILDYVDQAPFVVLSDEFDLIAADQLGLLDSALCRRFDEVLTFGKLSLHELRRLIRLRLRAMPHNGATSPLRQHSEGISARDAHPRS